MADTPEAYYRNALDLNRFGNGVQKKLRDSYNRIIVDAVEKLSRINEMPLETRPKYKAARLKALLKQTTESLARWSGKSEKTVIKELQGLAKVQVDFAVNQLEAALPAGIKSSVNSVEVSASYAESVVTKKATDLNASLLSDDLQAKVKGVPEKFSLTAKKGSQITLPNGEVLTKAFRGLASKQADLFGRNIRDGLLSGETTQQMARRLYGVLKFEGGGKATNNQISTLVKTSVQSVSNQAAQTVYEANQDISKEYRWIATLDSRTAPECQILDQTTHKYGQGPEPPQHFGCRCRTTAVLDYKGLGVDPPKYKYVKRSGEGGSVPIGTSYGKWLSQQSASYKAEALGQSKVKYFNALTKKYGPDQALKKLVREDGSAKTLKQLQKTYTKTPSKKLAAKPKIKPPSKALIAKEGKYMTAAEKAGKVKYTPLTAAQKKLVNQSGTRNC
ncbi:head morphogenesis protein [uncultured Mediterranean phage]|nr:head morphogenesis protein [uncultured Mediterranean phage]